jgi:hypothetical protein
LRSRGPADDLQNREDVAAEGLASYGLFQRETSLEVSQRFIVGPDDE